MSKKIVILNQKGGSGKTSTTVLFALSLAEKGHKVLTIDCDPQMGLTAFLMGEVLPDVANIKGLFDMLMLAEKPDIQEVNRNGIKFDFITSHYRLDKVYANADQLAMKRALSLIDNEYDYILFDTPPTVIGISRACCFIADEIFTPADISKSTLGPTLYTIEELKGIEKETKVILIGKDDEGKTGYKADLTRVFKEHLKDYIIGFIPENVTMQKAVAGAMKYTESQKNNTINHLSELVGAI